jgi:hypothetical protein
MLDTPIEFGLEFIAQYVDLFSKARLSGRDLNCCFGHVGSSMSCPRGGRVKMRGDNVEGGVGHFAAHEPPQPRSSCSTLDEKGPSKGPVDGLGRGVCGMPA